MSIPVGLSTACVVPGSVPRHLRHRPGAGLRRRRDHGLEREGIPGRHPAGGLVEKFDQPVLAVHAPTLLVTRGVFGVDPWDKVDRSIELAHYLEAPTVVLHRPSSGRPVTRAPSSPGSRSARRPRAFTWRWRTCSPGVPATPHSTRDFQAYSPTWDPVGQGYKSVTLDISHAATSGSDALAMARSLGPTLRHLHLTDGVPGPLDDHLLPGQGNQDCAGVLKHLVATGFEAGGGQVVVEVTTRSMTAAQRLEGSPAPWPSPGSTWRAGNRLTSLSRPGSATAVPDPV